MDIEFIHNTVCWVKNIDPEDAHAITRKTAPRQARQLTMYFARHYELGSLQVVAGYFGLDHATVVHACKTVVNDCLSEYYKKDFNTISRLLEDYYIKSISDPEMMKHNPEFYAFDYPSQEVSAEALNYH
jgi:hypothetical protein